MAGLRLAVIINPNANRGRTAALVDDIRLHLRAVGCEPEILATQAQGDATRLAQRCVADGTWDGIVAAGGDGTINEVVNGMWQSNIPLSFIPLGTGNDFVKMLDLKPNAIAASVQRIVKGTIRSIDVGTANERAFVNGVGMGIDAQMAIAAQDIKHLSGIAVYIAALFKVMRQFKAPHVRVMTDDAIYEGKKIMVTIGNGTCHGGGFQVTPDAQIDDGVFDICLSEDVGTLKILQIFPKVIAGKHTNLPTVIMGKTRTMRLTCEQGVPAHVDGEILGAKLHDITITLHPAAMKIRC